MCDAKARLCFRDACSPQRAVPGRLQPAHLLCLLGSARLLLLQLRLQLPFRLLQCCHLLAVLPRRLQLCIQVSSGLRAKDKRARHQAHRA